MIVARGAEAASGRKIVGALCDGRAAKRDNKTEGKMIQMFHKNLVKSWY